MKKTVKNKKRFFSVIAVLLLICVALISLSNCGNKKQSKDNNLIAEGVSISDVNVGSMTTAQAAEAVNKKVDTMGTVVFSFECEGKKFSVSADEIALKPEVEKTVKKAFSLGRGKDEKQNKKDVSKAKKDGKNIALEYSIDADKFLLIANDYLADKIFDPSPMLVEIGEDYLEVTNALPGKVVDISGVTKAINKELSDFVSNKAIQLKTKEVSPENLDFEEFKKEYLRSAKDAKYSKKDGKPVIEPEVVGIDFDEKEAKKIIEKNKDSKKPYKIPAKITQPDVTAKELEDKYINNIISTFSTSFAGSSAGRIENIRLAASKINGYVLNPGDRFSYNQVVGPRTSAAGFKVAQVYVGNQVVDGIGGGICQVSSALYNAVVFADLKTVSRTNHSIPVSYVPKGRDATVAYGSIDYVFQNNKSYPVSIRATISGTTLTISIVGTSSMDYTVDFVSNYVSEVPFSTVTQEDSSLMEGEEKIITPGVKGSVYESYRVYRRNGVEFDRKYESRSRYLPTAQKVAVGTKKASSVSEDKSSEPEPAIQEDEKSLEPQVVTPQEQTGTTIESPVTEGEVEGENTQTAE